jgi:hypothetical protein
MQVFNTIPTSVGGLASAVHGAANAARDLGHSMWVWPGEAQGLWLGQDWKFDDKRPDCHCIEVRPGGSEVFQYPDRPWIADECEPKSLYSVLRRAEFDALHQAKRDMFVYAMLQHDTTRGLWSQKAWVYGPFVPAEALYFRIRADGSMTLEIDTCAEEV